jgi:putative Holliday junction resolvase
VSKVLALDVGERRIGVAVSDATAAIATPLEVIRRASKAEDFARIAELVKQQGAEVLVVGHPLNADDSPSPQARRVERYVLALAEALSVRGVDVTITLSDEHGSTQRAQAALLAAGRRAKKRRERLDSAAAAVILQDYLDAQRNARGVSPPLAGGQGGDSIGFPC